MQQVFGPALAPEVMAGAVYGIGVQGAHLQDPPDPVRLAGGNEVFRESHMRAQKPRAVIAFFVEDADQVDNRVAAGQVLPQALGVMHIGLYQVEPRQQDQICPVVFTIAGQHPLRVARFRQAVAEGAAHKAGPAEHGDALNQHAAGPPP